jgi:hypothetical protein
MKLKIIKVWVFEDVQSEKRVLILGLEESDREGFLVLIPVRGGVTGSKLKLNRFITMTLPGHEIIYLFRKKKKSS